MDDVIRELNRTEDLHDNEVFSQVNEDDEFESIEEYLDEIKD